MQRKPAPPAIAALAALVLLASPAAATLSDAEIKGLDRNDNDIIDRGAEMTALGALIDRMDGEQIVIYKTAANDPVAPGALVAALIADDFATRLRTKCTQEKRFFLQSGVADMSLLAPGVIARSDYGAALSFSHDNLTGQSSWSVNGAMAWLPAGNKRCRTGPELRGRAGAVLSGLAFAPYLEFSGVGSSAAPGRSNLSIGIRSEFQYAGGRLFNLQKVTLNPYWRTDFDGKARITGIKAAWQPLHINSHLNGHRSAPDAPAWWWNLSAHADFQSVRRAGRSGLIAGNDYGWLGVKLGLHRAFHIAGKGGSFAGADYQLFHDVINDTTAGLTTVQLGTYLDDIKRNALVLKWEKGRDYNDLTRRDGLSLTLNFAF